MSTPVNFYYFGARARGETCRILMHLAGVEFNDVEVGFTPDHANPMPAVMAKEGACGVLPIARIDGELFGDSMALSRYFATSANVGGRNAKEWLYQDNIVNYMHDVMAKVWPLIMNFSGLGEEELKKKCEETSESVMKMLCWIDKRIGEKGGPFACGEYFSWADVFIGEAMRTICTWKPHADKLCKLDNLVKLKDAYEKKPEIKKWRDEHTYQAPV